MAATRWTSGLFGLLPRDPVDVNRESLLFGADGMISSADRESRYFIQAVI